MYFHRHIEPVVERIAKRKSVIVLTGARQVGKSTMLKNVCGNINFVSLSDLLVRESAKENPSLFFDLHKPPVIVDEIQKAGELFEYIKDIVDEKISSNISDSDALDKDNKPEDNKPEDNKIELINDAKPNLKKDEVELITDLSSKPLTKLNENVKPKKVKIKENIIIEDKKEEIKPIENIKPVNVYEKYTLENDKYKIYFRGNLIYDSALHKEKPIFNENGFILFGKNYIYRGIRFEKY